MMFHTVGSRTEPCGTPQLILTWCAPSIVVTVLSVRYVCTISVRYSLTPRSSNALTILSHGAVLKAFSTSNATNAQYSFLSHEPEFANLASLRTSPIASIVDNPFRKPNWLSERSPRSWTSFSIRALMRCFRTFPSVSIRHIGRNFLSSVSLAFGRSYSLSLLHRSGKVLLARASFITSRIVPAATLASIQALTVSKLKALAHWATPATTSTSSLLGWYASWTRTSSLALVLANKAVASIMLMTSDFFFLSHSFGPLCFLPKVPRFLLAPVLDFSAFPVFPTFDSSVLVPTLADFISFWVGRVGDDMFDPALQSPL
jgi:hypothetical protein